MDNQNLKVSVVIPTYNREKLIISAINSLKNQTYKNIEIVVVDDCSTDNTHNVMKMQMEMDKRIIYVKQKENKGAPSARNKGIEVATGELIAFLDSDDEWLPLKLEKQIEKFNEDDSIGVVYTGVKNVIGSNVRSEFIPQEAKADMLTELLKGNCVGTTSTVVVKKNLLLQVQGFDINLPSCQDWDLWVRLSMITNFGVIKEALVLFNEHEGERITTNVKSVVNGHQEFYNKYVHLIDKLSKSNYQLAYLNLGKIMIRTGLVDQNKLIINKGRTFLKLALNVRPSTFKVYILYLGSFIDMKILFKLYLFFKKKTSPYTFSKYVNEKK